MINALTSFVGSILFLIFYAFITIHVDGPVGMFMGHYITFAATFMFVRGCLAYENINNAVESIEVTCTTKFVNRKGF